VDGIVTFDKIEGYLDGAWDGRRAVLLAAYPNTKRTTKHGHAEIARIFASMIKPVSLQLYVRRSFLGIIFSNSSGLGKAHVVTFEQGFFFSPSFKALIG